MSEAPKWTAAEVYTDRWCIVDADGNEIADAIETKTHADLFAAASELFAALAGYEADATEVIDDPDSFLPEEYEHASAVLLALNKARGLSS